jgi:hypothetical protein
MGGAHEQGTYQGISLIALPDKTVTQQPLKENLPDAIKKYVPTFCQPSKKEQAGKSVVDS